MANLPTPPIILCMSRRTYAVTWHEDDTRVLCGKLELRGPYIRLEGWSADGRGLLRVFHHGDLSRVEAERHNGHRKVVLEAYGRRIAVDVIDGAGAFGELVDELRHRAEKPVPRP
jgi:hypothetical protein